MSSKCSMSSVFLWSILGAIILFVWSYVSWSILPWHEGQMKLYQTMQSVVAPDSMTALLVKQFIVQYIACWLVLLMLSIASIRSYGGRLGFFILFGLAASVFSDLPHWIWFRIPAHFTMVSLLDSVISWFFVGLIVGAGFKGRES